jgi:hypothetical protein
MTTTKSNATQANNSTLMLQVSNDLTVQVTKNSTYEYLMTTTEVAHGYDCSSEAIFMAKKRNPNDLIEGKHFIQGSDNLLGDTPNSLLGVGIKPNQLFWTKRGIIRLGFMLTSSRAVLFRDWAEDLIIGKLQSKYRMTFSQDEEKLLDIIKRYLVIGDVTFVAKALGISANHVTTIKNGRKRSHPVMQALVNRAKYNLDNNIVDGYKNTFVQTSLNLFNTKTTVS